MLGKTACVLHEINSNGKVASAISAMTTNFRLASNSQISKDERFNSVNSSQYKTPATQNANTGLTGSFSAGTATFTGASTVDVYTPSATPGCLIFTSYGTTSTAPPTLAPLKAEVIANGHFRITSTGGAVTATANWWILQV